MNDSTESKQNAVETTHRVIQLLRSRKEVRAAGGDLRELNQQIRPYRAQYEQAGMPHGKSYTGMLKWFRERAAK
jgi:hypothetical protein